MTARRLPLLALTAAALALVAVLVIGRSDDGYRVRMQLDDAAGLREGFLVKIAGAPVGKVVDVSLDDHDHAVAELQLDESAGRVGSDARAAVRASNLLGEKYVDLTPGTASRTAPSGAEIPRARTATPTDLDDILSVLDADTRVALGAFLVNQGQALAGRGSDLAATLVQIPPTLDAAQALVDGLAQDNHALGRLVEHADEVAATLAPRRRDLGRLVDEGSSALAALDARPHAIADTIARAPGAVHELRASLTQLEATARPLRPAARGLTASAPALTEVLRATPAFAAAARPTLRTARAVAPSLTRLATGAEPVVRRLRPAAQDLRQFATAVEPVTQLLNDGIADTLGVMQGWARAIQGRDGVGHVFRVSAEVGGDVLRQLQGYVDRGGRAAKTPGKTPAGRAPLPTSAERPQVTRPSSTPRLPVVGDLKDTTDKVTASVQGLLDYLLKP